MDYTTVKLIHQGAVALSLTGFLVRGAAALADAAWVRSRAARTLPHIVDTVLLASAVVLAWMLRLHPGNAPWILAKLIGLVVYIALGIVALRAGGSWPVRATALLAALATAGWIVSVAVTKSPLGLFAVL
ncbi:MAG: SirB2 family protein [Lautropia sp.]